MARIARVVIPNYPHHVTQRGNRKQQTFFNPKDYQLYLDLCTKYTRKYGVEIWAYCLMPNHVHMVAVPHTENSLDRCFSQIHRNFAYLVNKRYGWNGNLWQERFFSCVMDESHLLAAVRYIELNPVRGNLCDTATDWPWSSARAHINGFLDQLVLTSSILERIDNWDEYLHSGENLTEIGIIRKHTKTGRPAGSQRFVEKISKLTGRNLMKQKPGPKPEN
jgi:putative transposase